MLLGLGGLIAIGVVLFFAAMTIMSWRRIVPTNEVHVVQTQKKSTAYGAVILDHDGEPILKDGKSLTQGNVYYSIPAMFPVWGNTVTKLPVSNFEVPMESYPAYDKDRVQFELDLMAFLRINDPVVAAQRISSIPELKDQMFRICESAVRTVLGSFEIHEVMLQRTTLGEKFTAEIANELKAWGVEAVKNIALNDVRDIGGKEGPIHRIMAIKTAEIEADSRQKVSEQSRRAQEAEIENQQNVDIRKQNAKQLVGQREAEQAKEVGISQEKAKQAVQSEAKVTKEREMETLSVATQRQAEITKNAAIVFADQEKATTVIQADAAKQVNITRAEGEKAQKVLLAEGQSSQTRLVSEGQLASALNEAQGIQAKGEAEGAAATAVQMAPVNAQLKLAAEIGSNEGYQTYLVSIRNVEKDEAVGVAQAEAIGAAEIKVIANSGSIVGGVESLSDLFSSKGGQSFGAMLEGLAQTEQGQKLLAALPSPKAAANGKAAN